MAGKRIDQLVTYGSYDLAKAVADLFEVSKNSGTSGAPIYPSGNSRKIRLDDLTVLIGIIGEFITAQDLPYEITSAPIKALLVNDSNWNDNGAYIGTAISSTIAGCWYTTPATGTNQRYHFFFTQANTPVRMAINNVLLNG